MPLPGLATGRKLVWTRDVRIDDHPITNIDVIGVHLFTYGHDGPHHIPAHDDRRIARNQAPNDPNIKFIQGEEVYLDKNLVGLLDFRGRDILEAKSILGGEVFPLEHESLHGLMSWPGSLRRRLKISCKFRL